MANPVLVIMAAGMGSRYGGLKQIDPIGPNGQILLDYSIYDAHRAGFDRVVFIIRPELHEAFEDAIGKKARRFMQVLYPDHRQRAVRTGRPCACQRRLLYCRIRAYGERGAKIWAGGGFCHCHILYHQT